MYFLNDEYKYKNLKCLWLLTSFLLIFISLSFLTSCGKKGPPTLKSLEKSEPPSMLRAIHREDKIILMWNLPRDKESYIAGFYIFKSSREDFERIAFIEKDKRIYSDSNYKEGHEYKYKIITQNLKGVNSNDSNIISVTPLNTPLPPENIYFEIEDDLLILTWNKAGDDIFYNVYKSHEKGNYGLTPSNKNPLSENFFKDRLSIDKPVYYTIRSQIMSEIRNEGLPSEEIVVNPFEFVPTPPKDPRYHVTPDKVYLYWKESDEIWVTGYRIYRRIENGDYEFIGNTQIPTFLDEEKLSAIRDYRITAVGPVKEGEPAEVKGVIYVPPK